MKRYFLGCLAAFLALAAVLGLTEPNSHAQQDPTNQQQTIDAIAIQRINATRTAQANQEKPTATATRTPTMELPLTQTANFEATLVKRIEEIETATAAAITHVVVTGRLAGNQNANLRGCPTTTCEVVGSVPRATDFSILAVTGDWFEIELADETRGFVFRQLVVVADDAQLDLLPTPRPTGTPTPLPTSTPDVSITATFEALGELAQPKPDGYYIVGVDILPGRWESMAEGGDCYWERVDKFGDILANHFGSSGGTITLQQSDFAVDIRDCGPIEYVEYRPKVLSSDAYETKESGFYTVGVEIAPGMWRSNGQGGGCYWARLDRFQDITANYFGNAGVAVYVNPADYEVNFNDCGQFSYVGP